MLLATHEPYCEGRFSSVVNECSIHISNFGIRLYNPFLGMVMNMPIPFIHWLDDQDPLCMPLISHIHLRPLKVRVNAALLFYDLIRLFLPNDYAQQR
jgi:hypothetical protein